MPLIVTSGAKPAFFSRNWINRDSIDYGTLTATQMQAIFARVIDGDPLSYWQGDLPGVDGETVTIIMSMNAKSIQPGRPVDLFLFQNINWKNFHAQYSINGGLNYNTIPGGNYTAGASPATDYAGDDLQLALASQQADVTHLKVAITHTQNADEAKRLGGVVAAELKIQLSSGDAIHADDYRENAHAVGLGDGNESSEYILRSAVSHLWWGRRTEFIGLTQAEVASLLLIKSGGLPSMYYPMPGDLVRDCFQVKFGLGWRPRPVSKWMGSGFRLPLPLREVRA